MARLEYYIIERVLRGVVGNTRINYFALSGGAGGRRGKIASTDVVNNPYYEGRRTEGGEKDPKHVHGGPLPPGWYTVQPPSSSTRREQHQMGRCAKLKPRDYRRMMNRSGMFIHGQGRHGSDGCIVPILDREAFQKFMDLLDKDDGGTLFVDESVEGYRFA